MHAELLNLCQRLAPLHVHQPSSIQVAILAGLGYLTLVRLLRWCKYNAVHRQYRAKYEQGTLTPEDARCIMMTSSSYDMPKLLNTALAFALFKTYAIPSISKLLYATKELGSKASVTKRYADTEILLGTVVGCPMTGFINSNSNTKAEAAEDPRSMIALARVNYLHSHYTIPNDEFLYTLALFLLEPPAWAARYGWRSLSPMECEAYFIFWAEIGNRMGIIDIPESLEEMKAWAKAYEEEYMVPADTNKAVAEFTTGELLGVLPNAFGIKIFGERVVTCLLGERIRIAMLQPAQPWFIHAFVSGVMNANWIIQRWFSLPRFSPSFPIALELPEVDAGTYPRLHPTVFRAKPWYKAESSGLGYLRDRLLVVLGWYHEMPSSQLRSSGYRLEEMGPLHLENTANELVLQNAETLQGCPIAGPWSLEGRQARKLS